MASIIILSLFEKKHPGLQDWHKFRCLEFTCISNKIKNEVEGRQMCLIMKIFHLQLELPFKLEYFTSPTAVPVWMSENA